jgi:hypothetical protein
MAPSTCLVASRMFIGTPFVALKVGRTGCLGTGGLRRTRLRSAALLRVPGGSEDCLSERSERVPQLPKAAGRALGAGALAGGPGVPRVPPGAVAAS